MYPYSDGSPLYEFSVALILMAMFGALALTPARPAVETFISRLSHGLRRAGLFSDTISLSAEVHRLDLLRILVGCMVTWHYGAEFSSALAVHNHPGVIWFGRTTALSLCLTVGFLTPVAAILLLASLNILVVNFTLNVSIGSLAVAMCLIPMVLGPAGHTLSLDAVLSRFPGPVRWIYAAWGRPSVDRVQVGRFLALVAFAAINLYSALNHLGSQTWLDGLTTGTILLFPVIDPQFYGVADAFYAHAPALYVAMSKLTTYGMLVWQMLMLPLVLASRWTRLAAIVWGVIFFVFSAHVLHIKTLGTYEYVLFVLVFWSRAWIDGRGRHALMIFFDDRCNLCDRTVRTLAVLDLFHRLEFMPISKNVPLANSHGVSETEALTDLVGVTPAGRIYRGYDLYQHIAATVFLTLPLWPLLTVGRAIALGPLAYRFIADRRRRLFGVCTLGRHEPRADWAPRTARESSVVVSAGLFSFVVLLCAFVLRLPIIGEAAPGAAAASKWMFGRAPLAYGFGVIDVFNEADLKLYHNYMATFFVTPDGTIKAEPFTVSESMAGVLTNDARLATYEPVYCSAAWGDHIARSFAETAPLSARGDKDLLVRTEFKVASHPSREDLLAYRYAPLTWDTTCTTYSSVFNNLVRRIEYPDAAHSATAVAHVGE